MASMAQFLQAERSAEPTSDGGGAEVEPNGGGGGMGPGGVCSLGYTVGRIPSYATGCGVADHNWITKAINGDRHRSSLVAMSLRFDVEVNPGPGRPWRCTVCTKNLTRRDWSVKCNGCQGWTHWNCTELGDSGRWSKTFKSKCCEPGPFTSETRGYEQKVRRKRERVARRKRRQVKRDAKWRAAFLGKHRNTTVWTWNMQRARVSFPKRNRFTEILRYISKSQAEIVLLSELKEEEPGIKWIKTKDLYGVLVHGKRSGIILRDGWATDWREQGYVREYGNRCCSVEVNNLKLVAIYQPLWNTDPKEFEEYREELSSMVKTRKGITPVVGGDFNASVGNNDNRTVDQAIGPYGK